MMSVIVIANYIVDSAQYSRCGRLQAVGS